MVYFMRCENRCCHNAKQIEELKSMNFVLHLKNRKLTLGRKTMRAMQ